MEYNIINEYVNFIKKEFLEFFKIIFKNNYKRNLCMSVLEKYINIRYYDETDYTSEKDFIKRLNKELVDLFKNMANEENAEDLKNIIACFGYIIYFDEVCFIENDLELINTLIKDENIKIATSDELKNELKSWYINLKKRKEEFNDTIVSKEFNLSERKLDRKLYYLVLEHNVKISNLYSEYAINKAYTTGTVNEDKLFITYILTSFIVLNNAISLNFSNRYIVPISNTLFEKEKKFQRLINSLNNPLAKKNILIRLRYEDYNKYNDKINKLISEGYSFALELPDEYNDNIDELVLFPYVLTNKDSSTCEMLERKSNLLNSKIVKL